MDGEDREGSRPKPGIRFMRVRDIPQVELYQGVEVTRPVPRHVHWTFSLGIGLAGVRLHRTPKGQFPVTPGGIVVINCGEAHDGGIPAGYKYSSRAIRIDSQLITKLLFQVTGRRLEAVCLAQPTIDDPELFQAILSLHLALGQTGSRLEKECLLLEVIARLQARHALEKQEPGPAGNENSAVDRACQYLQDCHELNVSLDELAKIAGLSPFYFTKVFTRHTGIPPHAYQLQTRLKKATDLLAAGRPIIEVALDTGFYDQSHFQKAFKKKFGINPGEYRF